MSYVQREVVTITTDTNGDGTGYTGVVTGRVLAIRYVKADYANGVDIAITAEGSGLTLLSLTDQNSSVDSYPRGATNTTAGAASLYAAAGTAVNDTMPVAAERVKIVVSSGGSVKTGAFHVYIG